MPNLSSNLPDKPLPEPDPAPPPVPRPKTVNVSSLKKGERFELPGDDEFPSKQGVIIMQSQGVTRVKFDPAGGKYFDAENIAQATQVVPLP
jgi:hypothetical protein